MNSLKRSFIAYLVSSITFFIGIPILTFGDIIKGTVTDKETGTKLDQVKVTLEKDPSIFTHTNLSGEYSLNTIITGITHNPKRPWSVTSLFLALKKMGPNISIEVRNIRGCVIDRQRSGNGGVNPKHFFTRYPVGLYILSVKNSGHTTHFRICKVSRFNMFIQNKDVSYFDVIALSKTSKSTEDHTLIFTKLGFKETKITVSGSNNNVDMELDRVPYCGNGFKDVGEYCDSDVRKCNLLDPLKYESGEGNCDDSCSAYLEDACAEWPEVDLTGNSNAQYHKQAVEITGKAHLNLIKYMQAGMKESDLHVILDSVYDANNASGKAFGHITASGPNSTDLHYMGRSRTLQDGDVVVVDIGAKYNGWCADITRTFPVSGKFTDRQAEIYDLVLKAKKAAAAEMEPNNHSISEMGRFVKDIFRDSPLRAKDQNGVEQTMDNFFTHGPCHYIGKNVHGSDLNWSSSAPCKVGYTFTIEPGIYIKSEGIGFRIEDTYIMTSEGPKRIIQGIPQEREHIEALFEVRDDKYLVSWETNNYYPDVEQRSDHMDFEN